MSRAASAMLCLAWVVAAPRAVLAAPAAAAPAAQISALLACRSIADGATRLACYDKAAAAVGEAQATGDLLTLDREQRRSVRRQAFGLDLPTLSLFDRGESKEEASQLQVRLASARRGTDRHWELRLDDGALWRQVDDNELLHDPHAGQAAVIRRGALGSFFMKLQGEQAIRVRRER